MHYMTEACGGGLWMSDHDDYHYYNNNDAGYSQTCLLDLAFVSWQHSSAP